MKNSFTPTRLVTLILVALTAVISMAIPFSSASADKLKPEEIVAKHLESIGTGQARAGVANRVVGGTVVATLHSPGTAQFNGQAVLASEGNKSVMAFGFENADYSQERFGYDGKDVTVGYARPGVRSSFGDFILTHKVVLKEGLMGGTLSSAWPLLNLAEKNPKLEGGGTKKINGKQVYEIKYYPKGNSDLQISLFFDQETFRHVRTEYSRLISSQLGGTVDQSASQRTTRYKMIEDFSDFKAVEGLTLPHSYKITLELDTRNGTYSGSWDVAVSQVGFNQPFDPSMFNVAPVK